MVQTFFTMRRPHLFLLVITIAILSNTISVNARAHKSPAFLFSNDKAIVNPSLKDYATQASTSATSSTNTPSTYQVTMDIAQNEGIQSRLFIDGLVLEFTNQSSSPSKDNDNDLKKKNPMTIPLPGANGPYSDISTGSLKLTTHKPGTFISMSGTQVVPFQKECWEMLWMEGKSSGSIICGLDLPIEVQRNDATLPAGQIYMNFNVWTKDGLVNTRIEKAKADLELAMYEKTMKDALSKVNNTNNVLQKLIYFREASEAHEHRDYQIAKAAKYAGVPTEGDGQVIEIGKDLMLSTTGSIWMKTGGGSGIVGKEFYGRVQQTLLGYAKLKVCSI